MPSLCFAVPYVDKAALARITAYGNGVETGTGFFISSGQIVTAYHVIYGANRIDVTVNGNLYEDIEVVAVRPETDTALLRAPVSGQITYYRTSTSGPNGAAGSMVYVHGLPLGFENQLLVARLTQTDYLLSQQWINPQGHSLFDVMDLRLIPLDVTSEPGMSGAPVMDEQSNVFGVFSGSVRGGGRGYAWTVPISYVKLEDMQQIKKPASRILKWPKFVFLKPGLSLLQSLNQSSQAARVAGQCRSQIEEYSNAWVSQLGIGNHLSMKLLLIKPVIDDISNNITSYNSDTQLEKLEFHYEMLEPQLNEFKAAQLEFEKKTAKLITSCYSYSSFNSLFKEDIPATRENIIASKKFTDRVNALGLSMGRDRAANQPFMDKAMKMMSQVTNLATARTSNTVESARSLVKIFNSLEMVQGQFLSQEQANIISRYIQNAAAWAELMEAFELHNWEREHQNYSYHDPSGLSLELSNGWVRFDTELRNSTLAPGNSLPEYIKFIKFGPIFDLSPARAFAEVYWKPSLWPLRPTDSSQLDVHWSAINADLLSLQQREEATFSNIQRYAKYVGTKLLLEITGDMNSPERSETYRIYVNYLVGINGTASIICSLLNNDLTYRDCTELVNSIRLPH
jgi:hypothetical protein